VEGRSSAGADSEVAQCQRLVQ